LDQSEEELSTVRRLLGWSAEETAWGIRAGSVPLGNLRAGEFVLFISHISTGLGLPISSFFLLLLEDFGLQLQHLTPHSILLTAIFMHLCEMFVGVWPCVLLFRHFFQLVKSGKSKDEVGAYYFQTRSDLRLLYIPGLNGGKWDKWRREWVITTTEANEHLVMPTEGPTSDRGSWRAKPSVPPDFDSVLGKIRSLVESGLTLLHVLGDFLKRRIAPLKQRLRPAWSFTGLNDYSRTHCGEGSDLTQEALEVLVRAVTGEVFVPEHLILPQGIVSLCEDSRLRTAVLATLPTLDDGGLAARQTGGDPNHGLRIPGTSGDQAMPSAAGSGPTTKGKQAVAGGAATSGPSQVRSSSGASSGDAGRRRLLRGNETPVTEPAAKRQRTAGGAGQGSSRATGPHGSSRATAPPLSPPRDSSLRQQ
jgi:hypothetical protein